MSSVLFRKQRMNLNKNNRKNVNINHFWIPLDQISLMRIAKEQILALLFHQISPVVDRPIPGTWQQFLVRRIGVAENRALRGVAVLVLPLPPEQGDDDDVDSDDDDGDDDDDDSDDGEDGAKMIFPQPPEQRQHIENNLSMLSLTGNTLRH